MAYHRDNVVRLSGSHRRSAPPRRRLGRSAPLASAGTLVVVVAAMFVMAAALHFNDAAPVFDNTELGGGIGTIEGRANVVDGDTVDLHDARVRLHGIDAFERNQRCRRNDGRTWPCGAEAAALLRRLVSGQAIVCDVKGLDIYGRFLGLCRAGGTDVGAAMVRAGLALSYRQYTLRYVADELYARWRRVGAWDGTFTAPWDWRRG